MTHPQNSLLRPVSASEIKSAARGRCGELIPQLTGIPIDRLDGRQHPCPRCDGKDRFNAPEDFPETGGVFCRVCFKGKDDDNGGTVIDTVMWANGWD